MLLASETFDWDNKQKKGLERGVAPIFSAVSLPNIGFNRKSKFTSALDDRAGVFSNVGGAGCHFSYFGDALAVRGRKPPSDKWFSPYL